MENEVVRVSQELAKAKVNKQVSATDKQLLYLAIKQWSDNKTNLQKNPYLALFSRKEFERKFNRKFKDVTEIEKSLKTLSTLQYEFKDYTTNKEKLLFVNMFGSLNYDAGIFKISFNSDIVPILEMVEQHFLLLGFDVLAKFKSGFSITLYEKIKTQWAKQSIQLTRQEVLDLFMVQDKKSYENWNLLKKKVLDVSINEINDHTEYSVNYAEHKEGRKVIAITIYFTKQDDNKLVDNCHFTDRHYKTLSCSECYKIKKCKLTLNNELQFDLAMELLRKEKGLICDDKLLKLYDSLSDEEKTIINTDMNIYRKGKEGV